MKKIFTKKTFITVLSLLTSGIMSAQVANDICDNAEAIAIPNSGSICVTGTTAGATSDNTTNTCDVGAAGNEVWYKYIVKGSNNTVSVSPYGTSPATDLVVTVISTG